MIRCVPWKAVDDNDTNDNDTWQAIHDCPLAFMSNETKMKWDNLKTIVHKLKTSVYASKATTNTTLILSPIIMFTPVLILYFISIKCTILFTLVITPCNNTSCLCLSDFGGLQIKHENNMTRFLLRIIYNVHIHFLFELYMNFVKPVVIKFNF